MSNNIRNRLKENFLLLSEAESVDKPVRNIEIEKIRIPKESPKRKNLKCCRLDLIETVLSSANYRPSYLAPA
jgi:hypothetical protein